MNEPEEIKDDIRQDIAVIAAEKANMIFDYGATISHQWLKENLDCKLDPDKLYTLDQVQKHQLSFLSLFDDFKQHMLFNHKKHIVNIRGKGYVISLPKEQHEHALQHWVVGIHKINKKTMDTLQNVDITMLDHDTERRRSDISAKIASVSQLFTRRVSKGFTL